MGENLYVFHGDLDELMLFDRALSSDEVFVHHERFEDYLE